MASLYKKPVMVKDRATGRKVKGKSKKWWGQYKDADGRLCRKPLAVDKTAAKAMLNEIVRRVEREKAGLVDPTEEQGNGHFRSTSRSSRATWSTGASHSRVSIIRFPKYGGWSTTGGGR